MEDLANYAKENYGITIKSKDRKGDNTEKILKCFDITERFIKKVPGLEKYVKTIVYGIIDHKTMGYYNQNDRLLKIGEFGEDVTEEQVRTGYYGKMKHTVRHEMTHAIQYMIVEEFLSDKKKEQYEEAFKEHFRAAYYTGKPKDMARIANYCLRKVPGGQDSLAAAFDLFKELEGGYYKAHYAYFVKDLVSEKIVDTALRNLGLDKKRRHFSLAAAVGKNVEDFKGATKEVARISKYALSKDAECMAEAIADALGSGENAAPLSKEIMKVVEDIVGSKNIEMLKSIYAKKKPLFVVKKSLYDEISKGFINRSKLVPKQIQVRSKKGTGYTKPDFDAARKTLAPITYDDNGKVIPLSQRFNKDVDDIRKSVKIVVKKSFADNFMNNRSVPTLQKSLGIDNNDFSCTDFVKSIGENFDFETMRKVCII